MLLFFKDAAICITAPRLGFVWNMGSIPHLAIYFYFESPWSTEPELKLESPHPSINTHLRSWLNHGFSAAADRHQEFAVCSCCTSCRFCVTQLRCLSVFTNDLVSGLAGVGLVGFIERGSLLFSTTSGLCCLETTASCSPFYSVWLLQWCSRRVHVIFGRVGVSRWLFLLFRFNFSRCTPVFPQCVLLYMYMC